MQITQRTLNPGVLVELARKGEFAAAFTFGEQLLSSAPRDYRLDHLVGVIACQAGNPRRGAELLRRAHKARPADGEIAFNLARALAEIGDIRGALALCDSLPDEPRLQRLRPDLTKRAGNAEAAIELYRRQTAANPSDGEAQNNLGTALMECGDAEGALSAFAEARRLMPQSVAVLRNLSRALQLTHHEPEALAALREAHQLAPSDVGVRVDFGQALIRLLQPREAIEVLAETAQLDSANPAIFTGIGLAYAALAEFERAEEAYFHALAVDPDHAPALLNIGVLLEQSNRTDKLRELLAGAEARGVAGDEVAMLRALVLRRDNRFEDALAELKSIKTDAVDATMLAQTIAQMADRTGDANLAFDSFARMNEATANTPAGRTFDGSEHRRFVEDMAKVVTADWVADWQPTPASDLPSPAFLVGFPRSGTTLLDTALLGHSGIHVLEEEPVLRHVGDEAGPLDQLGQLAPDRLEELRFQYFDEVAGIAPAAGGKLILDKMPLSTLRGPLIARLFPDAPIIFALRHPCDAVLSCFMQNFRVNQAMASFLTLENGARFYDATMSYWMQCRELLPLRVHEVRYEDLVEDREAVLRPIVEFLDLPWEESVLRHEDTALSRGYIRTPSYAQVTEGIYRRASGRWERYRAQMEPVLDILAPWAIRFGYGDPRVEDPAAA
ncbi:MAG: sulfotransferase [Novosphingobium sp.]